MKTVLGLCFLACAAINFYWAIKVVSLNRTSGTTEEVVAHRAKVQKLNLWSHRMTGVACAIALIFLFIR
jgi:hypothetical protein